MSDDCGDDWTAKGRREPFGSGITSGDRRVVSFADLTSDEVEHATQLVTEGTTWGNTERNIGDWLQRHAQAVRVCPAGDSSGRKNLCCSAPDSEAGFGCVGARWRERTDFEWYVREIWHLWSQVRAMVLDGNAGLAAHYAVELGELTAEVNFKFAFEDDALLGATMRATQRKNGAKSRSVSDADRTMEIERFIAKGHSASRAFELAAAAHQGERGWSFSSLKLSWSLHEKVG